MLLLDLCMIASYHNDHKLDKNEGSLSFNRHIDLMGVTYII